jgi:hypothetical protein
MEGLLFFFFCIAVFLGILIGAIVWALKHRRKGSTAGSGSTPSTPWKWPSLSWLIGIPLAIASVLALWYYWGDILAIEWNWKSAGNLMVIILIGIGLYFIKKNVYVTLVITAFLILYFTVLNPKAWPFGSKSGDEQNEYVRSLSLKLLKPGNKGDTCRANLIPISYLDEMDEWSEEYKLTGADKIWFDVAPGKDPTIEVEVLRPGADEPETYKFSRHYVNPFIAQGERTFRFRVINSNQN